MCFIIFGKNTPRRDPLHGLQRVTPEVFYERINFLCFLPIGDINNMYPD